MSVSFPPEATPVTDRWYLDPVEDWTVLELLVQMCDEVLLPDPSNWKLQLGGLDLAGSAKVFEVLSPEDTVNLVGA